MTNLPQSARRRLGIQVPGEHPDAGLLTAFTEQALTPTERETVITHLASCASCREIVALSLPGQSAVEEVAPVASSRFRWPLLRWAAVLATAVIVWAAVSVLVPRNTNREAAVDVTANQRAENESTLPAAIPEPRVKVTPPPPAAVPQVAKRKVLDEARSAGPAPSNAPMQTTARDRALSKADTLNVNGAVGKVQAGNAPATSAADVASLPPPPPPPMAAAAAPAEQKPVIITPPAAQGGSLAGVTAESTRQLSTERKANVGSVGGPLMKDTFGATAVIAGTITDPSGAVVPNATVKITNAQTNTSKAVQTDSAGAYRTGVNPGVYSIQVGSPGMQTETARDVSVLGAVAQNFTLHPGAAAETVTVSAQANEVSAVMSQPALAERKDLKKETQSEMAGGVTGGADKSYKAWLQPRWRVTPDGALAHSADEKSWARVERPDSVVFRAVAQAGADVWAGGEGGALYHSSDDGRNWTRVRVGTKDAPVTDTITAISVQSAKSIIVTTSSGRVWSSKDSGGRWTPLSAKH